MSTGKAWRLEKAYDGVPKLSDFKLVEEKLPASLKDGEILVEALFLSVDPYMRAAPVQPGQILQGEQVARVKQSKNPKFKAGDLVQFYHGWRSLAVISPDMQNNDGLYGGLMLQKLADFGGLSPSLALGVLGMPGMTAYFGLEGEGKQPKKGEVVMVSGAAGAVGSVAGQIAKIKGAKVIGSAGSEEKCRLLREFGFDYVFNYRTTSVEAAMKQFKLDKIDLYFDNVGGDFSTAVFPFLRRGGRVVLCGGISTYNKGSNLIPNPFSDMIFNRWTFYGIFGWDSFDRFPEGVKQMLQWIKKGQLKYRETVTEGFQNMPQAFISLFDGSSNVGKAIVKV